MEERLRLAYLAAMDIPVWVPRTAGFTAEQPHAIESVRGKAVPQPVDSETTRPRRGTARDLMPQAAIGPDRGYQRPRPADRVAAAKTASVRFVIATSPGLLCVDASATAVSSSKLTDLIGGIGFAMTGTRQPLGFETFAWPMQGVSCNEEELRAATLGKLRKLRESGNFERLLLMGQRAAAVILGWSDSEFDLRSAPVSAAEVFPGAVVVTPSCQELLAEPLKKAALWRDLQLAGVLKSHG